MLSIRPGNCYPTGLAFVFLFTLQVFLRSAQVTRNNGELHGLRVLFNVFFFVIRERSNDNMLAVSLASFGGIDFSLPP